jgi:hypothetical protein
MVEQRISALQRIQVGLVGLVIVLLFVSLANMVIDRVAEPSPSPTQEVTAQGGVTGTEIASQPESPKAEPLADLGVAPATPTPQMPKNPAQTAPRR